MSESLLTHLDAPVLVGDPDGRAAYVNPAFGRAFGTSAAAARGAPLAQLFEGGAREAVLSAVARACGEGRSVRFRLRHGGGAWNATVSPIVAHDARVGVILLLAEAPSRDERLVALHRGIQEPLDELVRRLEELFEQTGGRRAERYRVLIEDGIRTLERVRKATAEIRDLLVGGDPDPEIHHEELDPVQIVRSAAGRVVGEFRQAGVDFDLLVPARLPSVRGDEACLERLLVHLLRDRLSREPAPGSVTVAAKAVDHGGESAVVISVIDACDADGLAMEDPTEPEPTEVRELVEELGGDLRTTADPVAGRSTSIRLRAFLG